MQRERKAKGFRYKEIEETPRQRDRKGTLKNFNTGKI
jgi:hypothetical protein